MKGLQNLTVRELTSINGGMNPHTTNVIDDGSGNGCTGPVLPIGPKRPTLEDLIQY